MEDKHLSTVLILVYTCFHAYKTTTIKAEQDFARAKAALGEQSLYEFLAKKGKEMRNMKFLIDRNLAQELWCDERLDAHKPKKRDIPLGRTETGRGWLQSRRQAVTEVIEHTGSITMPDMEEAATHPGWTDNHTKELQWQMDKLRKRKAKAFERELLLDGEVEDKVRMTAVELQKPLEESTADRMKKVARLSNTLNAKSRSFDDVLLRWENTHKMVADGLTKILTPPLALLTLMAATIYKPPVGRLGGAASVAVLVTQCRVAHTFETDTSVVPYSCSSRIPESQVTIHILIIILGVILYTIGVFCGIMIERYFLSCQERAMRSNFRDVVSQAPCTYTSLRGSNNPRFLPLPQESWG